MTKLRRKNQDMRHTILEMAFDKAKFQDKVTDRMQQIAHNWCLCMYCHLYIPDFRTYCHWKGELFDLLDYLNNLSIKDKKNKTRYTLDALTKQADYDTETIVFNACRNKFILEKELNVPLDKQHEVCTLFTKSLSEISKCIGGEVDALTYVNQKFPEVEMEIL